MSMFNPRGILGVIGVMFVLIALYLILEKGTSATQILGSLASGAIGIGGMLQGRSVTSVGNVSVSGGVT